MKVAYFGFDTLSDCLHLLKNKGHEIIEIFTIIGDGYDRSDSIRAFAEINNIPIKDTAVTKDDIENLENLGVELVVSAGYGWQIPISRKFCQVNFHPSCLPIGCGAWQMPICILRDNTPELTLCKLSTDPNERDVILSEKIEVAPKESLESITSKLQHLAPLMLNDFLNSHSELCERTIAQEKDEYWTVPADEDRFVSAATSADRASLLLRSFYGYGILYRDGNILTEVTKGRILTFEEEASPEAKALKLKNGWLIAEDWHPYFRNISIEDKDKMEELRLQYPPKLSDYTFSMIYCWQKTLNYKVYLDSELFVIKSDDFYMYPIGAEKSVKEFIDTLLLKNKTIQLRFCDDVAAEHLRNLYGFRADIRLYEDDCDYLISSDRLKSLPSSYLANKRNAIHHYASLDPPPTVEPINSKNLYEAAEISRLCQKSDFNAETIALNNFFSLGLFGTLVRRSGKAVAFCCAVEKNSDTAQGLFEKCLDTERGAHMFNLCSFAKSNDNYDFINMEDDMGNLNLRNFKRSLGADMIASYAVTIFGEN